MKSFLFTLPACVAAAMLAGCPQSKVPDTPPMVPQPKASRMAPHDSVAQGYGQPLRTARP